MAILNRRFFIKSPCVLRPTLKPENCDGWLLHALSAPTNKISSGDEIATPLASFHLGSITTGFPPLRKVNNPPQQCPPAAHLLPDPSRGLNTPWSAASRLRAGDPPFQHRERCDPVNFQKLAKFQLFLINRWFNVINTLDRATGSPPQRWLVHHQPQASVCTY